MFLMNSAGTSHQHAEPDERVSFREWLLQEMEHTRLEFSVPSRGLIGFRGDFMTATKGTWYHQHNI